MSCFYVGSKSIQGGLTSTSWTSDKYALDLDKYALDLDKYVYASTIQGYDMSECVGLSGGDGCIGDSGV